MLIITVAFLSCNNIRTTNVIISIRTTAFLECLPCLGLEASILLAPQRGCISSSLHHMYSLWQINHSHGCPAYSAQGTILLSKRHLHEEGRASGKTYVWQAALATEQVFALLPPSGNPSSKEGRESRLL